MTLVYCVCGGSRGHRDLWGKGKSHCSGECRIPRTTNSPLVTLNLDLAQRLSVHVVPYNSMRLKRTRNKPFGTTCSLPQKTEFQLQSYLMWSVGPVVGIKLQWEAARSPGLGHMVPAGPGKLPGRGPSGPAEPPSSGPRHPHLRLAP